MRPFPLLDHRRLRDDITRETSGDEPAFQPNFLDKYLDRMSMLIGSRLLDETQATLDDYRDPFALDVHHVANCSFTEFWRAYQTASDGPTKRTFKVKRRLEPTVVDIKPRLPRRMLKSRNEDDRREYCRVRLLLHRPFASRDEFDQLMSSHHGDYQAAYEEWATSDPSAPQCVRDDFRDLHLQTDGEHLDDEDLPPGQQKTGYSDDYRCRAPP